jgi:hypothetical protein
VPACIQRHADLGIAQDLNHNPRMYAPANQHCRATIAVSMSGIWMSD